MDQISPKVCITLAPLRGMIFTQERPNGILNSVSLHAIVSYSSLTVRPAKFKISAGTN
jgi:hypothetical protein